MISAPASRSASTSDNPVLPAAVGPQITMSGGSNLSAGAGADQRVRSRVLDTDVDEAADQLRRALEMHELVVPVAAGDSRRAAAFAVARRRPHLVDEHLGRAANPRVVRVAAD